MPREPTLHVQEATQNALPYAKPLRFVNISPTEAASGHQKISARPPVTENHLSSRRIQATDVSIKALVLTLEQKQQIRELYGGNDGITEELFHSAGPNMFVSQMAAAERLATLGLDLASHCDPLNRWLTRWSKVSGKQKGPSQTKRVLYQW